MVVLTMMSNLCFGNGWYADICFTLFYVFLMRKEKRERVMVLTHLQMTL